MRRVVLLAVWLSLIGTLLPASPALALSYDHPCGGAGHQVSVTSVIRGFGARPLAPPAADPYLVGTDYRGVIGDANVRNLLPCTNPSSTVYSFPSVIPANIEGSGSQIVQIGWMKCGRPGGVKCGHATAGVPNDGANRFVYICDDSSGGVVCDATAWAGTPVVGRRYRFRVQYNQTGTGDWDYSIKDLVTGVTKSTKVNATWTQGDMAWWGAETQDGGSTLGPASATSGGTNHINMYWMQYYRPSIGNWQVVTDTVSTSTFVDLGYQPSWFEAAAYPVNYSEDGAKIWTKEH